MATHYHLTSERALAHSRLPMMRALAALLGICLLGTTGFMIVEGWSFERSLYFTLITITTVGYGDEGISDTGRLYTSFILVGGIATASYSLALLVQSINSRLG